jgi:hypothetical protein
MTEKEAEPTAEERLAALLADLTSLSEYLAERGRHTYQLAERFMQNAARNPSSRAYDERQATMLEYQHHVWTEIAGLVSRLVTTYSEPDTEVDSEEADPPSETRS